MYISYCNKLLFRCKDNIKKTKKRTFPPVYTNLTQNKEEQHNPHISIDTTLQYAIVNQFHMEFRRAKRRQTAAKISVIIP